VVNNWTECEVGFEAVTQAKWVRFFFLSFHLLGVVLVNNLVIAFIISSFLEQLAYQRRMGEEVVGGGETVLRGSQAIFNASEVTGTKTTLHGNYVARLRRAGSDLGDDQERLRSLFTKSESSNDADKDSSTENTSQSKKKKGKKKSKTGAQRQ
jgi:hypothetical protein